MSQLKRNSREKILRHKAQLVAKGYAQRYQVGFDEVFALVGIIEMITLILDISSEYEWTVHNLDVKTIFVNGEIAEEVYVAQLKGFENPELMNHVIKGEKLCMGLNRHLGFGI